MKINKPISSKEFYKKHHKRASKQLDSFLKFIKKQSISTIEVHQECGVEHIPSKVTPMPYISYRPNGSYTFIIKINGGARSDFKKEKNNDV